MNEFDDLPEPTKEQWEEWEKQQGSVPRYSLVVDTPDHADSVEMEKQNWGGDWVRYPDHAAALQSKDAEIERLKEDLTLTRGAMDAQDQREREAGERCGVSWLEVGCDWPDWVADEVLSLRAKIERLKKDNSGLHEVQDEQRRIITSLRAELATAKARIAELEDNSLESLSTSDQVLVADMQRRLDETRAELATARTEVQRLLNNVHVSVQTMLSDELKNEIGYRNEQDVAIVVTRICDALTTARAEAQRNADAAEALAGLERLGYKYGLYKADNSWVCAVTLLSDGPKYFHGQTPIAAVRAAEQAKGEEA